MGKKRILVDGFIKAKGGYDCWMKMFNKLFDTKFVLFLECSKEAMISRMSKRSQTSGRLDDNDKIFMTRVKTFFERTYPCILLFEQLGMVRKVNTETDMNTVFANIQKAFLEFFPDFKYV